MAHYAKVLDGRVIKVLKIEPDFFENGFQDDGPGEWIQTSYNTRGGVYWDRETDAPHADQSKMLRYNFAGIGSYYDRDADAFYSERPYDSWTLNTDSYLWEAPVDVPSDSNTRKYIWDEENTTWKDVGAKFIPE